MLRKPWREYANNPNVMKRIWIALPLLALVLGGCRHHRTEPSPKDLDSWRPVVEMKPGKMSVGPRPTPELDKKVAAAKAEVAVDQQVKLPNSVADKYAEMYTPEERDRRQNPYGKVIPEADSGTPMEAPRNQPGFSPGQAVPGTGFGAAGTPGS
jgi:hypothetical protein